MQPSIRLNINNPCSESWNQMSPNDQGRFCGSCQKTVVDFAAMDDQEVLQYFAQQQGSVCGRFKKDQLDRPLLTTPNRKTRNWRYWHYLIAGLLFSSEASAQTKPASVPTTQHLPIRPETHELMGDTVLYTLKPQPDSIRGQVVDSLGRPISFATILYGPKQGVIGDEKGNFVIKTTKLSSGQTVTVSAVGYESAKVTADKLLTDPQIRLTMYVAIQGDVIAGYVTVKHPKKKRPLTDTLSLIKDTLASIGLTKPTLTAYPNPVARGGNITISTRLDKSGAYILQLYSSTGALITFRELNKVADNSNIIFPVPANLVPGIYFVRLSHPKLNKCYSQEIMVY